MPDRTPGEIRIRRRALTHLQRVVVAAQPAEGCALLLGDHRATPPGVAPGEPPAWEIGLIWPCLNIWRPASERRRRFALDPREQLLAQRWGRQRALMVLGAAHSHPGSAPVPSATDLDLAVTPCLQLILSPLEDWEPRCWWLDRDPAGESAARPLRWRMVD